MSPSTTLPGQKPTPDGARLLIFDTHPIQYRAPLFRELARRLPELRVYFFNERYDGDRWWFHEVRTGGETPGTGSPELIAGYPSETLGTRALGLAGAERALRAIFDGATPSAVLVYGYYLPEHWILRHLCSLRRVPLLFVGETFSRSHSRGARRWLTGGLRKLFFGGVAQFVSIGQKNEAFYRGLGIPSEKMTRARYCVDTGFFRLDEGKAASERARWRAARGIPRDAFVLLFVGRLFTRKRPLDLLELHARVKQLGATTHLVIVGSGPLEEAMRTRAAGDDRVHFLGFQGQEETRAAYYGADLLVLPSEYETWGLVVNEAFACGMPALVTDTCGVADDLVEREQTGFVYPVGAVDTAAEHVRALVDNSGLRTRLGENARKKVEGDYSVERFGDAVVEAVRRCGR